MWHNHKNHIGSPCRSVFDFLPNQWKNRKPHRSPKSEKPLYFCQKTEKPDGTKQKNRKPQRTTKPRKRSFSMQKPKNRPTKWPKLKNRKSQRPPPLSKNQWSFSLFFTLCFPKLFCADFRLFFSFTSPTIFTGPYFEDESVQWKMYQLVTIVIKFKSISKRLLNVQSTPDNSNPR